MTQENWLYVFVGSQGIFASKGYLAVSRGYLGKGYLGGGLLRREIVCWSTCLLFADALLHNVSATLGY